MGLLGVAAAKLAKPASASLLHARVWQSGVHTRAYSSVGASRGALKCWGQC